MFWPSNCAAAIWLGVARPCTETALIDGLKSMDDVMPRPTPDAQKALLDEIREDAAGDIDETLEDEFNLS